MIPIGVVFSLCVACTLLPIIISVPRQNHFKSVGRTNRAISDKSQGLPEDNHQIQEVVDNQHGENANLNVQKDVSNGSSSSETVSLHGETMNTAENFTSHSERLCKMCYCRNPLDEVCFELKCCNRSKFHAPEGSQQSVSNHSNSTVSSATNRAVVNEDHQENVVPNCEVDSKGTNENEGDAKCSFKNDSVIESEKLLPSKPATFDSDVSNETSPVSNDASVLFNTWTVIFIIVLTSTSLISAFKYAKQWRRDRMRENYLIDGLYSESRPLCLNDVLD